MQVESALLFESPEQLFTRVFAEVQPRGRRERLQSVKVRFCSFANANSSIKLQAGNVEVRDSLVSIGTVLGHGSSVACGLRAVPRDITIRG